MDHPCVGQHIVPFGVISLRSPKYVLEIRYTTTSNGATSGYGTRDVGMRIGLLESERGPLWSST